MAEVARKADERLKTVDLSPEEGLVGPLAEGRARVVEELAAFARLGGEVHAVEHRGLAATLGPSGVASAQYVNPLPVAVRRRMPRPHP